MDRAALPNAAIAHHLHQTLDLSHEGRLVDKRDENRLDEKRSAMRDPQIELSGISSY